MPSFYKRSAMYFEKDAILSPLEDQVGGHTSIQKYGQTMVCKPLVQRELAFYQHLPSELIGCVPVFGGVISVNQSHQHIDQKSSNENFVSLENLTAGYSKPCVLDLKMGTRMYTDQANIKKREAQDEKVRRSTSSTLGVRFCGSHRYSEDTDTVEKLDKYVGRDVDETGFIDLLKVFFSKGNHVRTSIVEAVLENVRDLRLKLIELDGVRLYSSSLLIVYDGMDDRKDGDRIENGNDDGMDDRKDSDRSETVVPLVRVKVIDFANATFNDFLDDSVQHGGPDRGFIFGLDSIIRILQQFMEDDIQSFNNNII